LFAKCTLNVQAYLLNLFINKCLLVNAGSRFIAAAIYVELKAYKTFYTIYGTF